MYTYIQFEKCMKRSLNEKFLVFALISVYSKVGNKCIQTSLWENLTVWIFSKSDAVLVSLRFLTNISSEFENLFFISLNDNLGHKYDSSFTVGIWGYEMAKKFLRGFDSIFHTSLACRSQKYERKNILRWLFQLRPTGSPNSNWIFLNCSDR